MNRKVLISTIVLLALSMMTISQIGADVNPARAIPPLVSPDWLESNITLPNLVILDVRSPDAYNADHIPGAVNVPSGMWYVNPPFGGDFPWMEIPPEDYLFELIGNTSITSESLVVVVGSTSASNVLSLYLGMADTTRAAITLLYAGIRNVAILDGGYDKWVNEGKITTTDPSTPTPIPYTGVVKSEMVVSKQYVTSKIGESIIVDARDVEVYSGLIQEPYAAKPGHIPTASNFPTPWLWDLNLNETDSGVIYATYKNNETLRDLAYNIVGTNMSKEIIVYCGVGGYASTMHFVLSEVLGYTSVKIYDGSAQEWTNDPELPVIPEGLSIGVMLLLSTVAAIVGICILRKRPKWKRR